MTEQQSQSTVDDDQTVAALVADDSTETAHAVDARIATKVSGDAADMGSLIGAELSVQIAQQTASKANASDVSALAELAVKQASGAPMSVGAPGPTRAMVRLDDIDGKPYAAFPSLVRLADGTYLGAFRAATGHFAAGGRAYLTTSADGRQWSAATVVAVTETVAGSSDVKDPNLTVLADGDLLLVWYDAGPRKSYLARSADNGITWGSATRLGFTWTDYTFCSAPVVELSSGVLIATAYGQNVGDSNGEAKIIRSTDGGRTWGPPITLASDIATRTYSEPNVLSLGGDKLLALIRVDNRPGDNLTYMATSTDAGLTWSAPSAAFVGDGNPHMTRLRSGAVVVIYRAVQSWNASAVGKSGEVRLSRDDGVTWSAARPVGGARSVMTYGSMVETERDGEILCLWGADYHDADGSILACYLSETGGVTPLGPADSPHAPRPAIANQGMLLRKSEDQPIASSTWTGITWSVIARNNFDGFAVEWDEQRFSVDETGYCFVYLKVQWTTAINGTIALLGPDGSTHPLLHGMNVGGDTVVITGPVYLLAGTPQYYAGAFSSAASPTIKAGAERYRSHLEVVKLKGIAAL